MPGNGCGANLSSIRPGLFFLRASDEPARRTESFGFMRVIRIELSVAASRQNPTFGRLRKKASTRPEFLHEPKKEGPLGPSLEEHARTA
jgi:hypothetical protein